MNHNTKYIFRHIELSFPFLLGFLSTKYVNVKNMEEETKIENQHIEQDGENIH